MTNTITNPRQPALDTIRFASGLPFKATEDEAQKILEAMPSCYPMALIQGRWAQANASAAEWVSMNWRVTLKDRAEKHPPTKDDMRKWFKDEIVACVKAYLMAKAHAEIMREKIDAIHREILTECPIYEVKGNTPGNQIFKSGDLYLADDEDAIQDFYDESDRREKAAGLKPADMHRDYCPALVAESLVSDTRKMLINVAGPVFGINFDMILSAPDCIKNIEEFTNLVCSFVVQYKRGFKLEMPKK